MTRDIAAAIEAFVAGSAGYGIAKWLEAPDPSFWGLLALGVYLAYLIGQGTKPL